MRPADAPQQPPTFRRHDAAVILLLLLFTLLFRFWYLPDPAHGTYRGKANFYTWIAIANCHNLGSGWADYWSGNVMYPYDHGFAFAENMLGLVPFVCPVWGLTANPILTVNLVCFLLLWLGAVSTYWVLRRMIGGVLPSLTGAVIFAFYPWILRIYSLGRIHMVAVLWLPLVFYLNWRFWREGRMRHLLGMAAFWLWTFLINIYLGVFLTLFVGVWNLLWFFHERQLFPWKRILRWAAAVFLVWLVMVPIFMVYYQTGREMGIVRTLDNQMQYTGPVWSWFTTSEENWLWGQKLRLLPQSNMGAVEDFMFPGFVVLALFAASFFVRGLPPWLKSMRWCGLAMMIFAVGPYAEGFGGRIPMPFILFWHLFPPLRATRNPHRMGLLVVLAAAFAAAWLLTRLAQRRKSAVWLNLLLLALITVESFSSARIGTALSGRDAAFYRGLRQEAGQGVVIELPVNRWVDLNAVVASTFHWRRVVNGVTGFWPPLQCQLEREMQEFPSAHALRLLQALLVETIVLHEGLYRENRRELLQRLRGYPEVRFLRRDGLRSVWSLAPGKSFTALEVTRHLAVAGPSRIVGPTAGVAVTVPAAVRGEVVFNKRAPSQWDFTPSAVWRLEFAGVSPVEWRAPALFHPRNAFFSVTVPAAALTRDGKARLTAMDQVVELPASIPTVAEQSSPFPLPPYLRLPQGFAPLPPAEAKAEIVLAEATTADSEGRWQARAEIRNPGPFYWVGGGDIGVWLGVTVEAEGRSVVHEFPLPHDLYPGDRLLLPLALPLPAPLSRCRITVAAFGRNGSGPRHWFAGH